MLLLGLLSVVQVAFLPGYLALRGFGLDRGVIRSLVWSFALSLVINHFLVASLVLLGIYRSSVLQVVFAAELAVVAYWTLPGLRRTTIADVGGACATRLRRLRRLLPEDRRDTSGILECMLLGGATLVAVGYGISGLLNVGQIFSSWDVVASWNRWAVDWAGNRLPVATRDYPQLLPANWSLTYVFIGDASVWFFAKAIMPLFCLMLLLATIDLYGQTRDVGYVCGTVLIYWLLVAILRFRMLATGYAEVPVAFFAFASVYALLTARQVGERGLRARYVLLGAVLAGGAALTKQAGLFMIVAYPVLAWLMVFRPQQTARYPGVGWRGLLWMVAAGVTCVLVAAPWYVYKEIQIRASQEPHIASFLLCDIHRGRDLWERLAFAGGGMLGALTIPGACAMVVLLGTSLRDPLHRWLTALIVVPFYLIWSLGFSYDNRNLALAIPFAGLGAGMGARELGDLCRPLALRCARPLTAWPRRLWRVRVAHVVVLVVLAVGMLSKQITQADLLARQRELQRSVGVPKVNEQLYAYQAKAPIDGRIVTDYWPLRWLPGFEDHYCGCPMNDLPAFEARWRQPDVRYALIRRATASREVLSHVEAACRRGMMRVELQFADYRLYGKREGR